MEIFKIFWRPGGSAPRTLYEADPLKCPPPNRNPGCAAAICQEAQKKSKQVQVVHYGKKLDFNVLTYDWRALLCGQRMCGSYNKYPLKNQWRTQEKISGGGFKVMAGLIGGPGAKRPGRRRIFEKLQKDFLRKLQKMHYFSISFKEIWQTMRYFFARLDEKHKFMGNFEKFSKIFKKYILKI